MVVLGIPGMGSEIKGELFHFFFFPVKEQVYDEDGGAGMGSCMTRGGGDQGRVLRQGADVTQELPGRKAYRALIKVLLNLDRVVRSGCGSGKLNLSFKKNAPCTYCYREKKINRALFLPPFRL